MTYRFEPMTEAAASQIDAWRYPPPYDFYDLDADPDDRAAFLDPDDWPGRSVAAYDGAGIVGFFTFDLTGRTEGPRTVEVGLGMAPDRTGEGDGETFVRAGLAYARARYDPDAFTLAVATFNDRAIAVYERVGFEPTLYYKQETNGDVYEFVAMRREL